MNNNNIINFAKTPRNLSKKQAKKFLRHDGKLGKCIISSFLISIPAAIIMIILYFLSIVPLWVLLTSIVVCVGLYFSLNLPEPKINDINNYPLSIGYVLMANHKLFDKKLEEQGGSMILFSKEDNHRLNSEYIADIGERIKNREVANLINLYDKMDSFSDGKSFFYFNEIPPEATEGVKVYCAYVILDSQYLPDGVVPENRLIPCLIDEKNRAIAIPSQFLE
ncbi:hypothetical protein ACWGOQ_0016465 [Aquimarina sp. M1]